jgi:hypothetical protein
MPGLMPTAAVARPGRDRRGWPVLLPAVENGVGAPALRRPVIATCLNPDPAARDKLARPATSWYSGQFRPVSPAAPPVGRAGRRAVLVAGQGKRLPLQNPHRSNNKCSHFS